MPILVVSTQGDGATERVTYTAVVCEEQRDRIVGSFGNLEEAQAALAEYRETHRGAPGEPAPLSWIEQSVRTLTLVHTAS